MTTLALFWPMPGLASIADPLRAARLAVGPADTKEAERAVAEQLSARLPSGKASVGGGEAWYWSTALQIGDSLPEGVRDDEDAAFDFVVAGLSGELSYSEDDGEDPRGLGAHVEIALKALSGDVELPAQPADLAETVAMIGMHAPANIAWRALGRVTHDHPAVTPVGQWHAAAVLAAGLRSLFSRVETTLLLDRLYPDDVYWRAVLNYAAAGNLQSVLDEYLHHFVVSEGLVALDDEKLVEVAAAAAGAIALRPSRYEAFDPLDPNRPIPFTCRFALRYGGRRQNEESSRQPEIRRAFNSPFWPFVLATTSIGQEGLDFHWWSHAVQHWNTPANPVDFEQREGRVNRYGGHAVRRNIVYRHRREILSAVDPNPWRAAYAVATDESERCGEFAPHWIYPGPSRIERHVSAYPLSVDTPRLERLKEDLALYRLTFGQPRQEDMLELLRRRAVQVESPGLDKLGLDLRPPPESG